MSNEYLRLTLGEMTTPGIESIFTPEAAYVVLSLVLIEGLLSVDNALAIAAMAKHLPDKQRKIAMTVGYAGAYGFRLLALAVASLIIDNHWLMILGAAYLIWLMCNHFNEDLEEETEGKQPDYVRPYGFAKTIAMIAFLDLSLSFDNVVAAVAFARDNKWFVYLGVTIGIITLRLVAGYCIKLIGRYPWLEHTAFILVGYVGFLLCGELLWERWVGLEISLGPLPIIAATEGGHFHIQKIAKFGGIVALVLGHIGYESFPRLRAAVQTPLRFVERFLAAVAQLVNHIVSIATLPIRLLFRAS
jgi:YkoY family integral membrane protein